MGIQAGVNGVSREVAELHCGVSGAVRSIAEGWGGVSGVTLQFWAPASKTYAWNQYNLVETTQYQWTPGGLTGVASMPAGSRGATSCAEDPDTGIVTFSNIVDLPTTVESSDTYYVTEVDGAYSCAASAAGDYYMVAYQKSTFVNAIFRQLMSRTAQITQSKGTLIGQVTSQDPDAYPQNGAQDGYWYEYVGEVEPEPEPLPDSFQATLYYRYTDSGGQQHELSPTVTFSRQINGDYVGYYDTDYWGYVNDLWAILPAEVYASVVPAESSATFSNGDSNRWTPTYYDLERTLYFIEGSRVQYLSGNTITMTLAVEE